MKIGGKLKEFMNNQTIFSLSLRYGGGCKRHKILNESTFSKIQFSQVTLTMLLCIPSMFGDHSFKTEGILPVHEHLLCTVRIFLFCRRIQRGERQLLPVPPGPTS